HVKLLDRTIPQPDQSPRTQGARSVGRVRSPSGPFIRRSPGLIRGIRVIRGHLGRSFDLCSSVVSVVVRRSAYTSTECTDARTLTTECTEYTDRAGERVPIRRSLKYVPVLNFPLFSGFLFLLFRPWLSGGLHRFAA